MVTFATVPPGFCKARYSLNPERVVPSAKFQTVPAALAPYCDRPWRTSLETVSHVEERYLDLPGLSAGGTGMTGPAFPSGSGGVTRVCS